MTSNDSTSVTVISRRYVDIRKLQRYLDRLEPGKYSVTVRNDNYFIKGPRPLTQNEQEVIHDLTRGRRSEKTEAKQGPAPGQHAAEEPGQGGGTAADITRQELAPTARTSSVKQGTEEPKPGQIKRAPTMKDHLFGLVRRLTGQKQ